MPNVIAALPNIGGALCKLCSRPQFGWRPLLECRAVMLPRCKTCWNMQGCPKLPNRSQPLVSQSSPYYDDMWRTYWRLTSFSPIVDTCLSCEDTARQSCAMVPRWRFCGIFCVLYFQRAMCSIFQICILNSHEGHTMCRSMVDIQSATTDIRRGKERRRRNQMTKI